MPGLEFPSNTPVKPGARGLPSPPPTFARTFCVSGAGWAAQFARLALRHEEKSVDFSQNFWSLHFPFCFSAGIFGFRQSLWLWLPPDPHFQRTRRLSEIAFGRSSPLSRQHGRSTAVQQYVFSTAVQQYVFSFDRLRLLICSLLSFRRTGLLLLVGADQRSSSLTLQEFVRFGGVVFDVFRASGSSGACGFVLQGSWFRVRACSGFLLSLLSCLRARPGFSDATGLA